MHSLLRSTTRLARPSSSFPFRPFTPRTVCPYSQQSYGGEDMSGHPKSDKANPKVHLEHPGPESPASKGKDSPSSSSPSSSSSSAPSTGKSQGSSQSHQETSQGGSPAISNPGPAPEQASEEVKKHNEEVAKSHDRPVNQIDDEGKVEKGFWKGESLHAVGRFARGVSLG
jgi:hypothetical protein